MSAEPKQPTTPNDWREAVEAAQAMLTLQDAREYGLITPNGSVDINACVVMIQRAAEEHEIEPARDSIARIVAALREAGGV